MTAVAIIGLAGSLRRGSYSRAVLDTLTRTQWPEVGSLVAHDLDEVPLFNQDLEDEPPRAVSDLRGAISACAGLVLISPEYNHGISGVLKNALDWASRPVGSSALRGKPVLTMTVSPSVMGGVRAHQQLNETMLATQSRLVIGRQIVIGEAHVKIEGGRLTDRPTLEFIGDRLAALVKACAPGAQA